MQATKQSKKIYNDIMDHLTRSQGLKQKLIPYLQEHYPHLIQKKSKLERIKECSNAVAFRRYLETGEVKLLNSNFCKYDRICLACATKRSMKMIKKYVDNISLSGLENKHWYMITLTIRHNKHQSLEELLDRLFGYRDIIARRMRNGKRPEQKKKSFFNYFDGMAIATEITYHKEKNGWHPHFHILACSNHDLPLDLYKHYGCKSTNDELYYERKQLTKDSDQIDIHRIQVNKKQYSRKSIGEVFKYAIKFGGLEVEQLAEIMHLQHKHHYRFFASYGIFRGWKLQNTKEFKGDWKDGIFIWDEKEEKYTLISKSKVVDTIDILSKELEEHT